MSMQNYERGEKLGQGTFGKCYEYNVVGFGGGFGPVCVKCIPGKPLQTDILREVVSLERCAHHPNIVQPLDVGVEKDTRGESCTCLVLELCGMDLRRRLQQLLPTTEARSEGCLWRASLPPQQVRRALGQVASALEYLNGLGLVHADLKPANILTKTMSCPLVADADAPASAQSCG